MKKILAILSLLLLCASARAQLIYGTLTITNTPVNGSTLTIQSIPFYWTNGAISGNAIQFTNTLGGCATNAYIVTATPLSSLGISILPQVTATSNVLVFYGNALTMSISTNWATLSLATNTGSAATNVVVPISAYANASRAPVESQLVSDISQYASLAFALGCPALSNYAALQGTNVFTGTNTFANLNGTVNKLTNGSWLNPNFTNGQNFGNPFRSPGTGTGSEQFGLVASATASGAVAIGDATVANATQATSLGYGAQAGGTGSVSLGATAVANNSSDIAIGNAAIASGGGTVSIGVNAQTANASDIAIGNTASASANGSMAIGFNTTASFVGSVAFGPNAVTTAAGQIMLGVSTNVITSPGMFANITVSNLTTAGSNILNGSIQYPDFSLTSLANGANAALPVGQNSSVIISGFTTNFSVAGIAGGASGREVRMEASLTNFTWTISNDSGGDPTATNRIFTGTGSDLAMTNPISVVKFHYDQSRTHWIVDYNNQR